MSSANRNPWLVADLDSTYLSVQYSTLSNEWKVLLYDAFLWIKSQLSVGTPRSIHALQELPD